MPYRVPPPPRTKVLRFCLDVLAKPGPCPEPWALMDGGDCQRTCGRCGAAVTDVGAMEPSEAEAFLEERLERPPFLDVYLREDGRVTTSPCAIGRRRQRVRRAFGVVATAVALASVIARLYG